MLITLKSKAHANITMFYEIGKTLIKYMGHSGAVPGAIGPEDLPEAIAQLKHAVEIHVRDEEEQNVDKDEEYVSLDRRAKPLIELLQAAADQREPAVWEQT